MVKWSTTLHGVDASDWAPDDCGPGDSGAIVFSYSDSDRRRAQVLGVVIGLLTLNLVDMPSRKICVVAPLRPSFQNMQEMERAVAEGERNCRAM